VTTEVEVVGQDRPPPEEIAPPPAGLLERAWGNLRAGNLGVLPLAVGLVFIVVFFSFKATNFFTASNFINIVVQMAGTTMLAYGVVFVLLLGEIDLSISYVAGIGALTVAILQNPGSPATFLGVELSNHELNGLVAMVVAVLACAVIGLLQGTVVAKVGVPSFVVTLGGFLIWQGVILHRLEQPGSIIIQDRWINYTANYTFSHFAGWLIAALVTGLYALLTLGGVIGKRRAGIAVQDRALVILKVVGVALASFGTVAICNHVVIQGTPLGLPLPGVIIVVFLVALTYLAKRTMFGRHVYAVGGNAEAARRAGINVSRIRILVFIISSSMAAVGGIILAANVNSVDLNFGGGTLLLNSIAAAVIGGTSLFGGRGEVWSAFIGAAVIATVSNGLNTAGYSSGTIYIVTGVILLLAVTLDTIGRRLQVRAGR
jgi:D-xylose transport system permease protein